MISVLLGVAFICIAIIGPILINQLVDQQLCDQLCIPPPDAEQWKLGNWLTNNNRSYHPPEYLTFHLYNLTNADDFQQGSLPNLTLIGPYTYTVERRKYNVNWWNDNSEVTYETFEQYQFQPQLSNGSDSDTFITVNLPYLAAVNAAYIAGLSFVNIQAPCSQYDWHDGNPNQSCLFQKRSVRDTLFGATQNILVYGNFFLFSQQINPYFQLYFNSTSTDTIVTTTTSTTTSTGPLSITSSSSTSSSIVYSESHERLTVQQNYGLGGACVPNTLPSQILLPCVWNDTLDFTWRQNTGQDDMSQLAQFTKYLGNSTLKRVWNDTYSVGNDTISSPEVVRGTDHFQFAPWVNSDDTLTIFDELIMRHADLTYFGDTSYLGVDMLRFIVKSELYANTDPMYWGGSTSDKISGMINISGVSAIRYGSYTPTAVTRPYQYHADPRLRSQYHCSNCPDWSMIDSLPADQVDSFMDVEPSTGKVLRGQKRAQFHAHLGAAWLFNATDDTMWGKIPDVYVPVFWFENGATMEDTHAQQVKDGLKQLNLAKTAKLVAVVLGSVVGSLSLLLGFYLVWRFNKLGGWNACCSRGNTSDNTLYQHHQQPNLNDDYVALNSGRATASAH